MKRRGIVGVLVGALFAGLGLSGCAGPASTVPPSTRVPDAVHSQPEVSTEGSLWTGSQSRTFLFEDVKAARIGDTVRVRIVENAKGSKDATTGTQRSSSLQATTNSFLAIPGSTVNDLGADATFASSFDGTGSTSRSGTLTAELTAIVTEVRPNGNLVIEGHREVVINRETERMTLRGVIRPTDIGPANTILSSVIADAQIDYSGSGVVNDVQGPGWLTRIVSWLWPF